MPNWCENKLTVYGPEADVTRFKEKAVGCVPWGNEGEREQSVLNFHSLVPIPAEVLKAGYERGCNWERNNWGCKWGACSVELVNEWESHLEYYFDTAWSPPIAFLAKVAPQWPSLTFVIVYEEMGNGFKGICEVQGDVVDDHCISLSDIPLGESSSSTAVSTPSTQDGGSNSAGMRLDKSKEDKK